MRREQLQQIVGVCPSEDWFHQCLHATNHHEEAILEQLLCQDLRNIVDPSSPLSASGLLRQAATQGNCTLPDTFQLLVQVETFVDMAVNAEKRLDDSGSHHRCLKIAFTDGYETYTAMEVTRMPDAILPGTKILLRGNMTIRHGICGWTPFHAVVLGGSVPELLQFHQQTILTERQRVGHGVDPTVKALIWMNDHTDAEHNDESDRASGDVAHVPPPMPPGPTTDVRRPTNVTTRPLNPPQQPPPDVPIRQSIPRNLSQPSGVPVRQSISRNLSQVPDVPVRQNIPRNPSQPPDIPVRQNIPRNPSQPSDVPVRQSNPRNPSQPHQSISRNPSQPPGISVRQNTSRNPYHQRTTTAATTATADTFPIPQSISPRVANPYASQTSTDSFEGTVAPPIEFLQLRELLQQSLGEGSPNDATYIVSMCQVGVKLNFNIERRNIGGTKTYGYIMDAKFGGDDPEKLITCRVLDEILRPCFSLPAAEMRKLSRSDKARSAVLIRDGGVAVNQQMHRVSRYIVKLSPTRENASVVDGDVPILHILRAV